MSDRILHRGPDDSGVTVPDGVGLVLAHRRLSIIDLSPLGHQPMSSASGRHTIIFNGEIYNYLDLRRELEAEGSRFRGSSDTEVLVEAFDRWGFDATVAKCDGMFAIAAWSRAQRTLFLARDRFGEKPLYFSWTSEGFGFASEMAALRLTPGFDAAIDRGALALFMRHNYVPAPYSIHAGTRKLFPGQILEVRDPGAASSEARTYWSAHATIERARREPVSGSDEEIVLELDSLLRKSVRSRMVADVPLGAFLSGGTDSSTIVALMQAQSTQPVKTFTIGFSEAAYDESSQAAAVAAHLGTDHTEMIVTPKEAMDVIPLLPSIYSEPFADSSQIPTYLVAKLARSKVTVALSGDAGDEFLGGYNRYFWGRSLWRGMRPVPRPARRLLGQLLGVVTPPRWDALFEMVDPILPSALRQSNPGHKLQKIARIVGARDLRSMYVNLVSAWTNPLAVVRGLRDEPPTLLTGLLREDEGAQLEGIERMMFLDTITYLPDDILAKVDRATMAVSLESRIPILSPELFEFSWRLPLGRKINASSGKRPLKAVLARYVPRSISEKPKQGFGIPIATWLRGPLRDWAQALLSPEALSEDGLLEPGVIAQRWDEHVRGTRNWQDLLWCVLMFQAWRQGSRS